MRTVLGGAQTSTRTEMFKDMFNAARDAIGPEGESLVGDVLEAGADAVVEGAANALANAITAPTT